MNLVEQYLAEVTADHHEEAVKHVQAVVGHSNVRHYDKHDAKQTGAAEVSNGHMTKVHDHLVGNGFSHKPNSKGDVHVYKKGKTTVTHYHGDKDINIHTKRSVNESTMNEGTVHEMKDPHDHHHEAHGAIKTHGSAHQSDEVAHTPHTNPYLPQQKTKIKTVTGTIHNDKHKEFKKHLEGHGFKHDKDMGMHTKGETSVSIGRKGKDGTHHIHVSTMVKDRSPEGRKEHDNIKKGMEHLKKITD